MFQSEKSQRRVGRFAWVMAWVGLVVGQLHALARYATAAGQEDLELPLVAAWARPASDLLSPLLTWASPDVVYVTYGKIWFPVFAAFTLCAYVVYRRRQPSGVERWAWWCFLAGGSIGCVGVLLAYWTQWSDNGDGMVGQLLSLGFIVGLTGLPLLLLGSTVLGITLLVKGFRPALPAVLLASVIPLDVAIAQVTSMGSLALPVMFAFAILGRRIASGPSRAVTARSLAPVASPPG